MAVRLRTHGNVTVDNGHGMMYDVHMIVKLHIRPFRLGLATFRYGIIYRRRGMYHAIGRRINGRS